MHCNAITFPLEIFKLTQHRVTPFSQSNKESNCPIKSKGKNSEWSGIKPPRRTRLSGYKVYEAGFTYSILSFCRLSKDIAKKKSRKDAVNGLTDRCWMTLVHGSMPGSALWWLHRLLEGLPLCSLLCINASCFSRQQSWQADCYYVCVCIALCVCV